MASNQLALALAYTLSTAWRRWLLPGLTHVRAAVFGLVYKLYVSPIGAVVTRLSEGKPPHTANKGGVAVAQQLDLGSGVVVRIVAVPVLDDNYSYLIIDVAERTAVAVDPADPEAVLKAARTEGVVLKAILTTHHHWDHSGGNERLQAEIPGLAVYGSALEDIRGRTHTLQPEGEQSESFQVGRLHFQAIPAPAHTSGHLMYLLESSTSSSAAAAAAIFTGDSLFLGGCGRFFEGNAHHLRITAARMRSLPSTVLMWPGHEYAVGNLSFAVTIEPNNAAVVSKLAWARERRKDKLPTVPSTVGEELSYNPFLRAHIEAVQQGVVKGEADELLHSLNAPREPSQIEELILGRMRLLKDNFRHL